MALPPGFVLEEQPSGVQSDVNLPPGFQLEPAGGIAALQPTPPEGGFIPAVQRGFLQTGVLLGDILPAMAARAVGADAYAEKQFKEAAETEKKIQEKYAPAVASYKDIKGVGDAVTYAVESVGELVPSILPSLFTGGLAGVVGRGAVIAAKEAAEAAARKEITEKGVQALTDKAVMDQIRKAGIDAASKTAMKYQAVGTVGGSALQNIPEVYQNIKQETEQESLGSALLFGGFNSLLDAALPLTLLAKARKAGIPGEEIVGAWYKRFGVGATKGFATEGATEAAQEMSSAAAEKFVDNNIDFFSEKNLERFINAGLKGGLGGGVVSGTTDVMLGKRSLTDDLKPLDQDIRDVQSDILARRSFLDELRAQAEEEGKNKLNSDALKDLGFGPKYSLYNSLLDKDINDPAQAQEVISTLQSAVQDPATKGRERVVAANTLEVINQYLETRGAPDVGQVVEEPSGAGVSVPAQAVTPPPAEGVGGVERTGVVPPVEDVGAPVGGEGLAAAPVAPVEAPVETVQPEAVQPEAVQPPAEPAPPTTQELIVQQETELAAQMDRFQNLLQEQVRRFGLKDVAVKIDTDLKDADGQYTKGLIKLALTDADPVRILRHESVHALKELGFFTPAQWNSLTKRANESWINTYLRNRNEDGGFLEPGQRSRYDAYINLFKQQGLDDAQIQEAMVEEAISDAFGDFTQTKAPPGMMRAILERMKNFFKAIKETVTGSGVTDPERLFGKIEKGEVAAPKPVAAAPEEKAEAPKVEAKPVADKDVKLSLRIMRGQEVPDIDGKVTVDKIGKYFDDKIKAEFDRSLDYNNPEDFARALKIAGEEVDFQLKQEKSGLDWYEDDVRLAFEDTAKVIPQLDNAENRVLFSVIAGIMSPQTTARDNWFIAAKAYQYYVETGNVPGVNPESGKLWQGGTTSVNKRIQLEFLDRMIKDMGQAETVKWLLSDHTVKEINQFRQKYGNIKSGIDGKLGDVKPGLYAFGPKVGPFVSNLNGIHDVTVDQWMIRTFNRYFGTMIGPDGEIIDAPTEPQRRAVKDLVNKAAEDANIKPYQVQSLLWFYEQQLYTKAGLPTKSYGFSDGGKRFLEEAGRGGGAPSVQPAAAPVKKVIEGKASIRAPRSEEFRQFMAGSKAVDADGNPIVYYHGSLRDKTVFRPKVAGAIFFSPDPSFAEGYIQYKIKELAERPGQYLSKEEVRDAVKQLRQYVYDNYGRQSKVAKDMLSDITEIEDIGKKTGEYNFRGELGDAWRGNEFQSGIIEQKMLTGRNITPVYISVKDPFDYEDRKQVDKVLKAMTRSEKTINKLIADKTLSPGMFPSEHERIIRDQYRDKILSGDWRTIELPEVQEAIRSLKHDGFYAAEEHTDSAAKNLAVYDSKQVVSATGNAGPFRQRPPTEEEAARVGMEPTEALKAQEEGDIRFSLRSVKEVVDDGIDRMVESANKFRLNNLNERYAVGLARADTALTRIQDGIEKRLIALGVSTTRDEQGNTELEKIVYNQILPAVNARLRGVERFSLRSKPFDPESLPTNNKEYTLPQNTILYHGAYETVADAIQSVGYLTSRPKIKAHGGLMNEGGLVWFGSKETAQKYADSEADPGKVRFDREAGIIREPGKVFEAITDQPYKLISRYKVLSAKEANALNEALGLPDYKRLEAGESANTAAYRADVYSASKAERFEIKSGKYTETVSAPWPIILKTLNADGFYSDGTVALTAENGIRLSEEGKPMQRFSLRSSADPAINARIMQTTSQRDEKNFPERITDAIGPENRSRLRAMFLNRYNRLGEYDKRKLRMMGGADLMADANAESAALLSDIASGIVAGALGVYDQVGGVPVYNRHFVVERRVMGARGPQFITIGGKIQSRQAAEALARRYPDAVVKERGYTAVTNKNNTIKGPIAIFAPLAKLNNPDAYRAYQYWAGVKRGSKWITNPNGQVVEQLFDKADIPKAEQLRQEYLAQGVDFNQIQKEWITYNDQLVQYMLDTGVISRENADKFRKHGDYLPFYRQINGEDDAVGPRIFQSISAVKAPRKIKGGEDPLGDFLENVVRNTQSAVQAGLKNVAARRAADVGMDLGQVAKITQAQADAVNSFYVLENGQKVFYNTDDPLFIESIKSLGVSEFPGIGLLAGPAGVLRNLVTKDPGFMLANMMRDSLSAWATSGVNMVPVAATLKNFTEALAGQSPEFKALLMSGVIGGYDYSQGTKDAADQFGKELRKTAGTRTVGEKALSPFTYLWEGLEKGTQASDAATRMEVYKKTLQETGNEAEALFRALEVMNFNRRGNNPIVRVLTAAVPFLNARMQGLDVLYRAGFNANTTQNSKAIQKAFWTRGMYMAALSTMYWMLTHDDEEYKRQEQETRDNNWLFPSMGIKIPIPFEVGVLFKVIPERIAALAFGEDTTKDFLASMGRNLASTLAFNPIPQAVLPLFEATTNFSFFTFRPIVGQGMEGVSPAYQVGPSTSRIGQLIGELTKDSPSILQISPMKADAIIQGYTGTIGSYMSQLFDSIYDMHTDNPKASLRFEQMPVVKRFALDPDARGQVTAYYDMKNAVDEATRTANLLERSMDWEQWGKYYTENVQMFAFKDYILDMEKTMKDYRDLKNMIRVMPMTADEKRDSLRAITQIENDLTSNIQTLKKQVGK